MTIDEFVALVHTKLEQGVRLESMVVAPDVLERLQQFTEAAPEKFAWLPTTLSEGITVQVNVDLTPGTLVPFFSDEPKINQYTKRVPFDAS